ncbi:unnamed protein product, partial [Adineta steineri]
MVMTESGMSLFYNTNPIHKTNFDCFYAHMIDDFHQNNGTFLRTNSLTPYCLRPLLNDSTDENSTLIVGSIQNTITFKSLRSQQIRSEELLQWSISIDIIEAYAIYLIKNDTKFDEYVFYNCSLSWFGSRCQYTFGLNISIQSFGEFLVSSFDNRKKFKNQLIINTCYQYLPECYRGPSPMCLDWREICNGIIDCIGVGDSFGIDEDHCEELEMNECKEDEYRCQNGAHCIPLEFFRDGWPSKDCLDGTDEEDFPKHMLAIDDFTELDCIGYVTFSCEERSCRDWQSFPCGDGQCRPYGLRDIYDYPEGLLCPGTSRDDYYLRLIYITVRQLPKDCYKLLSYKLKLAFSYKNITFDEEYWSPDELLSTNNCSLDHIPFPAEPVFNGFFQVIYSLENLIENLLNDASPDYVCNDPRQCLHLPETTIHIGGLDCRPFQNTTGTFYVSSLLYLHSALIPLADSCSKMGSINKYPSNSSLFFCELSKRFISKHRLVDGIDDCDYREDEEYPYSCLLNDSQRYSCPAEDKCLSPLGLGYTLPDCIGDNGPSIYQSRRFVFTHLCNLVPDYEEENHETDETNCEWWPCYTPYTRCDELYQCTNAIDETGCPAFGCAANELKCDIENPVGHRCISHDYIYEKAINCSGIPVPDRRLFYSSNFTNEKNEYLSWKEITCLTENHICGHQSINNPNLVCNPYIAGKFSLYTDSLTNIDNNESLCTLKSVFSLRIYIRYFSAWNLGYFPLRINSTSSLSRQNINVKKSLMYPLNNNIKLIEYCNRGFIIYEGKSNKKKCLCPPNYFGSQCQWQSQRISLTLKIRKLISIDKIHLVYQIFIYLIDDENQIKHYYERINYIPSRDCLTKFNRYLLYPNRPKNKNKKYSIHIDIYDKITLDYYASYYLSIPFQFLPVNRLSTKLIISSDKSQSSANCPLDCGSHGKCFDYVNIPKSFCQCNQGYSGRFCNLTYECLCSPDSICLNSSICLCPSDKFGSQCYLQHTSCQPHNPCQNNGQCMPIDDRINEKDFICFCSEGFMGLNCQYKSNQIDIHFKTNIIPSIIFVHLINAFDNKPHERITIFKKVPIDEQSVTLFIEHTFNILFIQFHNNSYLTVIREKFVPSEHISTDVKSENICVNVSTFFNATILNYTYLRRLKYYQFPCLQNPHLKCFYDEIHMCICDQNRYTNCLEFDHNISYDCQRDNPCQNEGKCFQNNVTCPQSSICMCQKCYYGNKCQFNTEGFDISLDAIFGYHIKPFVSFVSQSKSVKITLLLTIIMLILGFSNGLLSIMTFRRTKSLEVGCGIYLLINSIV